MPITRKKTLEIQPGTRKYDPGSRWEKCLGLAFGPWVEGSVLRLDKRSSGLGI